MSNPGTPEILAVRDLHKAYQVGDRRLEVLRGVDLSVERGEFVALKGASGAGKSTLLHLCGGLDTADQGEIVVVRQSLRSLTERALALFRNRQIGFVFQAYHLLPELTALENVYLPARIARMPVREARLRANGLLERVGLSARSAHRPSQLSGGEQQRVGIARALVNSPEIILADEPTGNLDSRTGAEVFELLLQLQRERHLTLIIATHDPNVAQRAERVMELVDGRFPTG